MYWDVLGPHRVCHFVGEYFSQICWGFRVFDENALSLRDRESGNVEIVALEDAAFADASNEVCVDVGGCIGKLSYMPRLKRGSIGREQIPPCRKVKHFFGTEGVHLNDGD